jgi:hypothetical protein
MRISRRPIHSVPFSGFGALVMLISSQAYPQSDDYLRWSLQQAETIGRSMRKGGRVGSRWSYRGLHTERASNYKLRATWLTPEVIRASARVEQLRSRLSDETTKVMVAEAEAVGDTVIMIEIDPDEGSGVIPLEWQAFLQPKNFKEGDVQPVGGVNTPKLRALKALAGVAGRDYNYDVFWMVFRLLTENGQPILSSSVKEAELVVRIYDREARVTWLIPDSIRNRSSSSASKPTS